MHASQTEALCCADVPLLFGVTKEGGFMPSNVRNWLAAIAVLFTASWAHAQATVYTVTPPSAYAGVNNFTAPCGAGTCQNFTLAMAASGSFTTSSPMAGSLVAANIFPLVTAFSFSDGLNTYSSADAAVRVVRFNVSTDAGGAITSVLIAVERWQTGTSPHTAGDRLSVLQFGGGATFAAHNTGCSSVGISLVGMADTCLATPSDASRSEANGPAAAWFAAAAPGPTSIPTLSEWSLIVLAGCMGLTVIRRRRV